MWTGGLVYTVRRLFLQRAGEKGTAVYHIPLGNNAKEELDMDCSAKKDGADRRLIME